jgi:hypothetical protein
VERRARPRSDKDRPLYPVGKGLGRLYEIARCLGHAGSVTSLAVVAEENRFRSMRKGLRWGEPIETGAAMRDQDGGTDATRFLSFTSALAVMHASTTRSNTSRKIPLSRNRSLRAREKAE